MAADLWGIEDGYYDAFGVERVTSPETRAEVLGAMGLDPHEPGPPDATLIRVIQPGDGPFRTSGGRLELEGGGVIPLAQGESLPADLPVGYHVLTIPRPGRGVRRERQIRLIVSPGACYLPHDLRTWGWAVQLYAARSRASWGIGDLADLRALGAYTRALGGGAIMVNPLSAPAPIVPVEASPYYPSSRRFRNPLYLRIEEIPGATESDAGPEIAALAHEARALDVDRLIRRDRVFVLKMRALELLWRRFGGDAGFDEYRRQCAPAVDEFAAYCVLAERHGKDWRRWPEELRHPSRAAVKAVFEGDPRARFHVWIQWLLDEQLRAASKDVMIVHDLPVGFDIAGADGWCWQDLIARNISVGCPPDGFNLDGQDWGLAPFIPTKLRASFFRPFVETIRASLRHAGGLRIDHVMGLFRLFWIPRALGVRLGTYVRYPADEMLAILAVESHRARATIVGEDLGTVLPGTRETLALNRLLSYRLLFFEPEPPPAFPELAVSSVTTHDLATVAGIWTGKAIEHMRLAGVTPNVAGLTELKARLARLAGVPDDASIDEVIVEVYRALGRAPSRVLLATLDDALGVIEQPNLPGTTTSWPNWSLALPLPIEEMVKADLPRRIAAALRRA